MSSHTVGGTDRSPGSPWDPPLAFPVGIPSAVLAWPNPVLPPDVPVGITEEEMLHISVYGLRDRDPSASSSTNLSRGQKAGVALLATLTAAGIENIGSG